MKKNFLSFTAAIALLLTLCVSFNACQKEGVYNPKQKISKIYQDYSLVIWSPETGEYEYFTYTKKLTQGWNWDNDKLSKIDYYFFWGEDANIYTTARYFYEKKQLVKIDFDDGEYIEITYDGSKYKKVDYFFDGDSKPWISMSFTYNKNKISNVTIVESWESYWGKAAESNFLSSFLPKEFVSKMVAKSEKKRAKKSTNTATYNIDYTYTGDNINEMRFQYIDEDGDFYKITAKYASYDSKNNPFYKKFDTDIDGEFIFGNMVVTPKNNPLEVNFTLYEEYDGEFDSASVKFQYTYTYSKNFPTEVNLTLVDEDGYSWQEDKVYYEYK